MAGREPRVEIDNSANDTYPLTHLMVTMTPPVLNRTVLTWDWGKKGDGSRETGVASAGFSPFSSLHLLTYSLTH